MALTEDEKIIQQAALEFARKNKKNIAKRLTDIDIYIPEENPVSVFMAGSPGAGKTEASIELLAHVQDNGSKILRIDPDELRKEFKTYNGENSWLFLKAVSVLVEKIHDFALKQKQSFILDGTLTNYDIAERNINRSIGKGAGLYKFYMFIRSRIWRGRLCRLVKH